MRVLELFKGTGSLGKICDNLGWDCISLDIEKRYNPDILVDIMKWNYEEEYSPNDFDIIAASPVCLYWSKLRNTWIGRRSKKIHPTDVITKQHLIDDINKYGKPMVDKVFEILEYFNPKYCWIENPLGSTMWNYIDEKYSHLNFINNDFSYCKYSDWGYRKDTRFMTNYNGIECKKCKNDCDNIITIDTQEGAIHKGYKTPIKSATRTLHINPISDAKKAVQKLHKARMGTSKTIETKEGKIIRVNTKELREKYKDYPNLQVHHKTVLANGYEIIDGEKVLCNTKEKRDKLRAFHKSSFGTKNKLVKNVGGGSSRDDRYRIPPLLIEELLYPILLKEELI